MSNKNGVRTEVIYLIGTIAGSEHQISQDDYEQLKPLITKPELYGSFSANTGTEDEIVVPMRNIVLIRKERRGVA